MYLYVYVEVCVYVFEVVSVLNSVVCVCRGSHAGIIGAAYLAKVALDKSKK